MKPQEKCVKFRLMLGFGRVNSMNKLITTWLQAQNVNIQSQEYDEVGWAVDELFNLAYEKPEELLSVITNILEIDSSQRVLGAIGAGALEDLIVHHGDRCIDKVVELSLLNKKFKAAINFTYIDKNDVSSDVYEKFQKLKLSI